MGRMDGDLRKIDMLIIELGHQYGENGYNLDFDDIHKAIIKAYNLGKDENNTRRNKRPTKS